MTTPSVDGGALPNIKDKGRMGFSFRNKRDSASDAKRSSVQDKAKMDFFKLIDNPHVDSHFNDSSTRDYYKRFLGQKKWMNTILNQSINFGGDKVSVMDNQMNSIERQ